MHGPWPTSNFWGPSSQSLLSLSSCPYTILRLLSPVASVAGRPNCFKNCIPEWFNGQQLKSCSDEGWLVSRPIVAYFMRFRSAAYSAVPPATVDIEWVRRCACVDGCCENVSPQCRVKSSLDECNLLTYLFAQRFRQSEYFYSGL